MSGFSCEIETIDFNETGCECKTPVWMDQLSCFEALEKCFGTKKPRTLIW